MLYEVITPPAGARPPEGGAASGMAPGGGAPGGGDWRAAMLAGIALAAALLAVVLWRQPPLLVRWAGNVYALLVFSLLALALAEA